MDTAALADGLAGIERQLDPAQPEVAGVSVLAYGEISATLALPGTAFEGLVGKRMSGFPDEASAHTYRDLVERYCAILRSAGLSVLDTQTLVVPRAGREPVVYLVQPRVAAETLGSAVLHRAADDEVGGLVGEALRQTDLARAGGSDGLEVAIDAQLSNFAVTDGELTLLDVGTPFLREHGAHQLDMRVMLAAVPPGIRAFYLRRRIGEEYMDDYYDRRLVAVDLLGNFIKEGARSRIPAGLAAANNWLGAKEAITSEEVERYYRTDASTLQLFLRVRRADRWLRRRVLRQPYDFILPGRVQR